jgi:DNA repair protein RadC
MEPESIQSDREEPIIGADADRMSVHDWAGALTLPDEPDEEHCRRKIGDPNRRRKTESIRYTPSMHEMPRDERPRERLLRLGAGACTSAELIAILFRTGSTQRSALGLAEELLHHFHGLHGAVLASVEQMQQVKGIGEVKAIEILAAVELGKRLQLVAEGVKPTIRGPQDAANILMPELRDEPKEHLKALMLDTKNRVMRIVSISVGTLNSSVVHPREVFRESIISNAAAIVLVHNHPSGDPTPSEEDRRVTTRLAEVGREVGIELLDHIVLGHNRFVSMKEKGMM